MIWNTFPRVIANHHSPRCRGRTAPSARRDAFIHAAAVITEVSGMFAGRCINAGRRASRVRLGRCLRYVAPCRTVHACHVGDTSGPEMQKPLTTALRCWHTLPFGLERMSQGPQADHCASNDEKRIPVNSYSCNTRLSAARGRP